ncbi:cytochrome b/b6 domain-containing protein [Kushneria marisflavi]|uniref:cytochrome b/b6 domain-containing protein n=1 Tax=Kushneria marisflavi TaxID=157779 RepID=UPI001B863510
MTTDHAVTRHSLATRLVHAGLAIAVIIQLSTSLVMHAGRAGDPFFQVHSFSGLTAMVLVTLFWIVAVVRTGGAIRACFCPGSAAHDVRRFGRTSG